MPLTGVLADRMATYIVGFSDNCARNAPPEIVFMSRDDSPVRVRVWLPQRYDVMRPVVAVLYKNRPRRILLPAAVRVVDNGTDDKGIKPDCFALLSLIDDEYTASQPIRSNCYNLKKIKNMTLYTAITSLFCDKFQPNLTAESDSFPRLSFSYGVFDLHDTSLNTVYRFHTVFNYTNPKSVSQNHNHSDDKMA